MSLQNTPSANRLHIGIFGKRNSGKSSLINAITNQEAALTSPIAGTTTDPVFKAMEIHGLGPCMLIDTAGFDDEGELGELRVQKTAKAIERCDIIILVCADSNLEHEKKWLAKFINRPTLAVVNKSDLPTTATTVAKVKEVLDLEPVVVSAAKKTGLQELIANTIKLLPEDFDKQSITGNLVKKGDIVLLVMPQDIQAPKGRLILPQVQTIRDLLDNKCIVVSTTSDQYEQSLTSLKEAPSLIITDSQVFKMVHEKKPAESLLTSFSVLMAALKGDIKTFTDGARAIDSLTESSSVLIAEACTHKPLQEDIGREQIPRMLRKKFGKNIGIDIVNGQDFPADLSKYNLVIHCGACMFNRKYVLSRIERAKEQGIPITNYGVVIAKITGILDKITY